MHKKTVYGILFQDRVECIAKDFEPNPKSLDAKMGMVAITTYWGQNLSLHPHCIVLFPWRWPYANGKWKYARTTENTFVSGKGQ